MSDEPYVKVTNREVNEDDPKWMQTGDAEMKALGATSWVAEFEWSDKAIADWNAIFEGDQP